MNYDPLRPTPQWACPYCACVFTAPNARLMHLETMHNETVDKTGAYAAVQRLHNLLARISAREAKA